MYLAYLPVVDEPPPPPPPQNPSRVDSILSYLDEANQHEVIIDSVRSQKSSTSTNARFNTPPPSTRQQQPKKVAQSVAVPQTRASPSVDQQTKQGTKVTTPHKSLMVATQPPKPLDEEEIDDYEKEATQTAHDVTETVLQLRMENEEKQRQTIILQQRLVSFNYPLNRIPLMFIFRTNNVN